MTVGQIIGLVVVLLLGLVGGFFIIRKSKKHTSAKWLGLFFLLAIGLTWVFGDGNFNSSVDIANGLSNGIYFASDKILFLIALGAFYGLLSKNRGYNKLVNRIAEFFKNKEIIFAILVSLIITAMTAVLSQTFIALLFVPFIISIALKMHLDKITAFALTFGSMLVGLLGVIYGGEGLYWFSYYTQTEITTGILYRLIVLVIGYVLFNFLTIMRIRKLKRARVNEEMEDPYQMEKYEKNAHAWPISVIFGLMFVLIILGYVDWYGIFKIEAFNNFHTWLLGLKIGNFEIFKALLGTQSPALGMWGFVQNSPSLVMGIVLLIIFSIIVALLNHRGLGEVVTDLEDGSKKMFKSVILYGAVSGLMMFLYISPVNFVASATEILVTHLKTFNPYVVTAIASVSNIFHTDLGLTGFLIGGYLMNTYQSSLEIIYTIFTTMYGFVGMFVPTSGLLLIGLGYLNIDYKNWFKHIWLYIVGMLIILLVLFTIMAYV